MNLHRRVFAELAPGVRDFLCHKRPQAAAALEMLDAAMRDSFGNLPAQYIHGDSHQGNILTDGDEVVGFVDLDHLPKGPRIYDIGYVLVDMVKWDIQDPNKSSRWIRDFNAVVKGYDHGQALSQREKGGILYVMLAVQMLMTEEFLKRNNMPWAELNAEAFFWLFEHRENIQKQIFQ